MAGKDVRTCLDDLFQTGDNFRSVVVAAELHECHDTEVQLSTAEHRPVALDDACLLQALHALPAGCFAQPDALRELCVGQPPVLLENIQYRGVHTVEIEHIERILSQTFVSEKNILRSAQIKTMFEKTFRMTVGTLTE